MAAQHRLGLHKLQQVQHQEGPSDQASRSPAQAAPAWGGTSRERMLAKQHRAAEGSCGGSWWHSRVPADRLAS